MVNRWRCRHCEYTVWSASRDATTSNIKSHIIEHHQSQLSDDGIQRQWSCPYCDASGQHHDRDRCIEAFQSHLLEHVQPLLESGKHVADDINGTGSVLVLGGAESTGVNNARVHFLSPGDIVVIVTTNPAQRLRLLNEELSKWPASTVIITTTDDPLAGVQDINFTEIPLEIVKLDKKLGLGGLGETISRVIQEYENVEGKLSVEVDILEEIIQTFDIEMVFKFLHALTGRMKQANALSHYYVNPSPRDESTLNILKQVFDLQIVVSGSTFVSKP